MSSRYPTRGAVVRALLAAAALIVAGVGVAHAQSGGNAEVAGGTIHGVVLDAATAQPIAGALICLTRPEESGAACSAASLTDAQGRYRFDKLGPRSYRLRAIHVGYEERSVEVDLQPDSRVPVWLTLPGAPVRLEPLALTAARGNPFDGAAAARREDGARSITPAGQPPADTHVLDEESVFRSFALGEPDLLRSLRRLPGVTTRSDYTAELWTRGAPWYQTRVYFDGVPLFQPLHALGSFTAIATGAVGSATFQRGVRTNGAGEAAAGLLDVRSRRATGEGQVNGRADASLVGLSITLDQRLGDGVAGWMFTGRRAHLDWLSGVVERITSRGAVHLPFTFSDYAAAADLRLGDSYALEASVLHKRDEFSSAVDPAAHWGSTAARITVAGAHGRVHTRHTIGASMHAIGVPDTFAPPGTLPTAHADRLQSSIAWLGLTGDVQAPSGDWRLGYEASLHTTAYEGSTWFAVPRPASSVLGASAGALEPIDPYPHALAAAARFALLAGWAERVLTFGDAWLVRGGLRVDASEPVFGSGMLRFAPRVALATRIAPRTMLSASAGRSYQYAQAVAPAGVHMASLSSGYLWLLPGEETPALRADVATLGVTRWLGSVHAQATAYVRNSAGMTVADPTPGPLNDRAGWVVAYNRAAGVELSADTRTARYDASAAYTLGSSVMRAGRLVYSSAADTRHALDLNAGAQLGPELRLGAAWAWSSGVPFTRIFGVASCATAGCDVSMIPWSGDPNASRAPAYASLDLMLDWQKRIGGAEARMYMQLRNALGRENATIYAGPAAPCTGGCGAPSLQEQIERGLPRVPFLGLHVRF